MHSSDPRADVSLLTEEHEWLAREVAGRYFRFLPPGASLDDLIQECWLAVYRTASGFDGTGKVKFCTIAAQAASRAAQRHVLVEARQGIGGLGAREHSRVPEVALGMDESNQDLVCLSIQVKSSQKETTGSANTWTAGQWRQMLTCLTTSQRTVAILRLFKGLTDEQTGRTMGIRTACVRHLWQQALDTLRTTHQRVIRGSCHGEFDHTHTLT